MPPPSRLARVSRFRLRLPLASRFVFPSFPLPLVFVMAGPLSPPFEKALVFFSIVSQTFSPFDGGDVRMSDDCSFLSLSNPHFLIFLFLITASRPFISPKTLQNSRSFSKFKLYSSAFPPKSNVHENRVFSPSLLFLLSFSLSVLALFLSSFSVRLSVDIPGVH